LDGFTGAFGGREELEASAKIPVSVIPRSEATEESPKYESLRAAQDDNTAFGRARS
jgi:hypothetical protein